MLITLFWLLHFAFGKYSIISLHSVVLATVYTFESSKEVVSLFFSIFFQKFHLEFYFILFYFIFQLLLFSSIFHFRINLCICLCVCVCEAYVHFMLFPFFILYNIHIFFLLLDKYCDLCYRTKNIFSFWTLFFFIPSRNSYFLLQYIFYFFMQFIVFVYSWISFSFILSIGTCYLTS